jgi:Tol biopolymer transport system component
VHRHDNNGGDIWLLDSEGPIRQLTFDALQENSNPVWSPDGSRIIFGSRRNGKWGIYRMPTDGTSGEELLYESSRPTVSAAVLPMAWSPDGQSIVFYVNDPNTQGDQWLLRLDGDKKPVLLIQTPGNDDASQISPDGKWIAFRSDKSGRQEIYMERFPSGSERRQVSKDGGVFPRWRGDSKELFYNSQSKMYGLEMKETGSAVSFADPIQLFDYGDMPLNHTGPYFNFAVSADGQRFLIPRQLVSEDAASASVTVILHWTASVKR